MSGTRQANWYDILRGIDPETIRKVQQYHRANRWVWEEFEHLALKSWDDGKRWVSAKWIVEELRRDPAKRKVPGREFKINNKFTAYYSRIFTFLHPDKRELFEQRVLKGLAA